MTSTTNKTILAIGLTANLDPNMASRWSAEQTRGSIEAQQEVARQAGFDMDTYQVDLTKSYETILKEARDVLKSKAWDGVSIGFGVRGTQKLTPLFEQLVNAVVQEVQPTPKLMFALTPDDLWNTISRGFDVKHDD